MKSIDRLLKYLEYKNIKPTNFESNTGMSSGYISKMKSRNADFGESTFIKINDNCPDLNIFWLLTGKGEMLETTNEYKSIGVEPQPLVVGEQSVGYGKKAKCERCEFLERLVDEKERHIATLNKLVDELSNHNGSSKRERETA